MNKEKLNILFYLIFFFGFVISQNVSLSQSKKQLIEVLNFKIDSVNQVITKERNAQKIEISSLVNNESKLNQKIELLNVEIKTIESNVNAKQKERQIYESEIFQLKNKLKHINDSIIQIQNLIVKFNFPYKYSQPIYIPNEGKFLPTVYLDFNDEKQIITDSLLVKFNEKDIYHFYYFTPITEDLNIQCPMDFGYIVFDNSGKEIFRAFNPNEIGGNAFGGYLEFDLVSKKRRLMGLLSTGCGSGGSIQYYDLEILNGKLLQSQNISVSTGGFETTYFLPERNVFVELTRINPQSNWGEGKTRYTLDFYSLINDQKIASRSTKYFYPHFGYVEVDEFLKNIEKREPNIFKY